MFSRLWTWVKRDTSSTDWLIVLLTAVIAGTSYLQWHEIKSGGYDTHDLAVAAGDQAKKIKDMSEAADKIRQAAEGMVAQEKRLADKTEENLRTSNKQSRDALNASIAQFRNDQRAWVGVSEGGLTQFEASKPLHLDVVLLNTGKTPARQVQQCTGYVLSRVYLKEPTSDAISKCESDWKPSHDLPPQGKFTDRAGDQQMGSPEDQGSVVLLTQSYDAIKNKIYILYIFGEYKYRDLAQQVHTTKFCVYIADPDTKTVQFCEGFNDME